MTEERKKYAKRPKLRASLVLWNEEKGRYIITTPQTAKSAVKFNAEAVFLLTDTLDPKDAKDIKVFLSRLAESEIASAYYFRGPVTGDAMRQAGITDI